MAITYGQVAGGGLIHSVTPPSSRRITQTSHSNPFITGTAVNPAFIPSFTTTTNGINLSPSPAGRLSTEQLGILMTEHHFIPMEENRYCLFCYAFDVYRTEGDHEFLIHED